MLHTAGKLCPARQDTVPPDTCPGMPQDTAEETNIIIYRARERENWEREWECRRESLWQRQKQKQRGGDRVQTTIKNAFLLFYFLTKIQPKTYYLFSFSSSSCGQELHLPHPLYFCFVFLTECFTGFQRTDKTTDKPLLRNMHWVCRWTVNWTCSAC